MLWELVKAATSRMPRHYQQIAINRTVDAIARMESDRLLTMAKETGNTHAAFQIIRRPWKSRARKRIPLQVDRNLLADQTKPNNLKPIGTAMTKINNRTGHKPAKSSLRAQRSNPVTRLGFQTRNTTASKVAGMLRRCAPGNDEFLRLWTLYQAVTGNEEEQNINKQFSSGFLNLVISDECHRGSAADDAASEGRNPRADYNGNAPIHPCGFRRRARGTVTPVGRPAWRWNPHGEAVRLPPLEIRLTRVEILIEKAQEIEQAWLRGIGIARQLKRMAA